MRDRHVILFVAAIAAGALGCAPGPGSFALTLEWGDDGPPTAARATTFVDVRTLDDPNAPPTVASGRIVAEASPVAVTSLLSGVETIRLDNVPHEKGLFVVAQVHAGPTRAAPLLAYGLSDVFDFSPGERVEVTVHTDLRPGPNGQVEASGVTIAGTNGETFAPLRDPNVTLILTTDTGVRAEVSNFEEFSTGTTTCLELGEDRELCRVGDVARTSTSASCPDDAEPGRNCEFEASWNLNEGFDDDCGFDRGGIHEPRDRCPRRVYVRFYDANGAVSRTYSASGNIDTRPPAVSTIQITYEPAPDSPLTTVESAGPGTRARMTLAANEELGSVPDKIDATNSSGDILSLTLLPGTKNALGGTYLGVVHTGLPDGEYRPSFELADLAGNRDTFAADDFIEIKTSRPTLIVDQTRVSYLRSPAGRGSARTLGEFEIPAGPYFALAPTDPFEATRFIEGATFRLGNGDVPRALRIWGNAERTALLSPLVTPNEAGDWSRNALRLTPLELPTVWVSGFDDAGNETPAVRIENAWYLGVSSPLDLPTRSEVDTCTHDARLFDACVPSEVSAIGDPDDGRRLTIASRHVWDEHVGGDPRAGCATMTYDSSRGDLVLVTDAAETWTLRGRSWTRTDLRSRNNGGTVRTSYDAQRGAVVSLGFNGPATWNGRSWSEFPANNNNVRIVFDASRQRVTRVDLSDATASMEEWDGTSWTALNVSSGALAPRREYAMAYDETRDRIVVFGGSSGGVESDETWEWNGTSWVEVATAGPRPDARRDATMFYDGERIMLFGGVSGGTHFDDLWAWDGNTWTAVPTSGPTPAPRRCAALAQDRASGRTVLFGGQAGTDALSDAWTWDGTSWTEVSPSGDAPPEGLFSTAYDEARERVVFAGDVAGEIVTWEWDGRRWNDRSGSTAPPAGSWFDLAYDPGQQVVALTAAGGDVWAWDGAQWTDVGEGGSVATLVFGFETVFDRARNRIVAVGGPDLMPGSLNLWEFDGALWSNRTSLQAIPQNRSFPAVVFDRAAGVTIVQGGMFPPVTPSKFATWAWNGAALTTVTPTGPSFAGYTPSPATYDPVRQRTIVYDGGTQVFENGSWSTLTTFGGAPSLTSTNLVQHEREDQTLLMSAGGTANIRTWELLPPPRPSIRYAMTLPRGTSDRVREIRVEANCGGGSADGAATGATLSAWRVRAPAGDWVELGSSAAPTDGTAENTRIVSMVEDAAEARAMVGPLNTVSLKCSARGDSVTPQTVGLDYAELLVRYAAPN
ncbi:MAG: kelch repeat-containing protein [Deltaproteobacteria bacterium]